MRRPKPCVSSFGPFACISVAEHLRRYRFGAKTIDFLLCSECGVYVAAYMDDGDKGYANVIINVLDDRERYSSPPAPADYDDQDAEAKAARRRRVWTPATLTLDN